MTEAPRILPAAAHRLSDVVRLAIVCGRTHGWLCVNVEDGGTDGRVYDNHSEAVRWNRHAAGVAFLRVPMDDMSPFAANEWLDAMRKLLAAGLTLADPDYPNRSLIAPMRREMLR